MMIISFLLIFEERTLFFYLVINMEAIQTLDLTKHYSSRAFKRNNIPALEKVSLSVETG